MKSKLTREQIKDFLRKKPSTIYVDEEHTSYELVNDELIIKPITFYNSNENLKKWQNKLLNNSSDYPVLDGLEHAWAILEEEYNEEFPGSVRREQFSSVSPFDAFMYMVGAGFYPTPEVLLAIHECFETYINMEGKVSLEDVFFGKKERGIGNYSAREARARILSHLDFCINLNHLSLKEKKSQYLLAEEVIELFKLDTDPETLLRQYRRHKKNVKTNKKEE
ncbi:MAG: hypothetical protein HWE27_17540 [Gammaproteobacteria bacterium]|nr:hypothetical protein [Gammaproteobacteria bacterium]